ncbi:hypothetical protein LWI28_024102 [Acer negundo]|uniref:Coenzyme Q-binding protein COQ10 START domain-containing protein n=1 Tax=Acer negundo TaxID=4023 RepID=A0AAD5J1D4_ACENE|nr:hypothetical protein LWI28_024102 [Acer negundo]KAK4848730.1 hypothetical protein QYF36_016630 [Acer negundo]
MNIRCTKTEEKRLVVIGFLINMAMSYKGASITIAQDENSQSLCGDGVYVEIKMIGNNTGRVESKIEIDASLDTVWNILTDYEKFVDLVPCIAASHLVEKKANISRVCQIGQINLPLGLKFSAKVVVDYNEKDVEILSHGRKRYLEFKMIEGDLQFYQGMWSVEQFNGGNCEEDDIDSSLITRKFKTVLSYEAVVKPKPWMPVRLVAGVLGKEIKVNISCIREAAQKVIN